MTTPSRASLPPSTGSPEPGRIRWRLLALIAAYGVRRWAGSGGGVAGLLGRWLLIGWLLAGVVAMHVLTPHNSAAGHGMNLQPAAATASMSVMPQVVPLMSPAAGMSMSPHVEPTAGASAITSPEDNSPAAIVASAFPVPGPLGHDMSGEMAGCVLFLTTTGALILVLLLLLRRSAEGSDRSASSVLATVAGRAGLPRPRIALCVLRV